MRLSFHSMYCISQVFGTMSDTFFIAGPATFTKVLLAYIEVKVRTAIRGPRPLIMLTAVNEFRLDSKLPFLTVKKWLTLTRILHCIVAKGRILAGFCAFWCCKY